MYILAVRILPGELTWAIDRTVSRFKSLAAAAPNISKVQFRFVHIII